MDMSVLRNTLDAVYVSSLEKYARDGEVGRRPIDWLGYCMLPWSYHTLKFFAGSRVWRDATKFVRRYW